MLLMSVTFAVAAVRLARRDTLVQQMSATESLAAVDTICVDKTGTLTDGELRLVGVEVAEGAEPAPRTGHWPVSLPAPATATAPWRRSPSASPARPARVSAEVPFSSEWKWSGATLADGGGGSSTYVLGAPDVLAEAGVLSCRPAWRASSSRRPRPGAGSSPSASPRRRCPRTPPASAAAAADAAGAGRAGGDAAARRRGDDRDHARGGSRPEADLRRRPRHRDRRRLRGRGAARGRRGRGPRPARRPRGAGRGGAREHDLLPDQAGAEESAGRRRWSAPAATWR